MNARGARTNGSLDRLCTQVITTSAELITEIVKGQTPEQKQQLWAWYIEDVKFWRKLFNIGS